MICFLKDGAVGVAPLSARRQAEMAKAEKASLEAKRQTEVAKAAVKKARQDGASDARVTQLRRVVEKAVAARREPAGTERRALKKEASAAVPAGFTARDAVSMLRISL